MPKACEPSYSQASVPKNMALPLHVLHGANSLLLMHVSVPSAGPHKEKAGAFPQSSFGVAVQQVSAILT